MKKLKNIIFILILLNLFTFTKAYSYSKTISSSLENNILRLHIIGNSNNYKDQIFKLKCRDKIIEYLQSNISYTNTSKKEIINFINSNINTIYNICNNLAKEENLDISFNISITNSFFPTKQYGNILMPSGNYDALKISIGSSKGNNWWCSLFPPLCFTKSSVDSNIDYIESTTNPIISATLSTEETNLLTLSKSKNDFALKFKIIELFNTKIK